jgi:hypothetical protein
VLCGCACEWSVGVVVCVCLVCVVCGECVCEWYGGV